MADKNSGKSGISNGALGLGVAAAAAVGGFLYWLNKDEEENNLAHCNVRPGTRPLPSTTSLFDNLLAIEKELSLKHTPFISDDTYSARDGRSSNSPKQLRSFPQLSSDETCSARVGRTSNSPKQLRYFPQLSSDETDSDDDGSASNTPKQLRYFPQSSSDETYSAHDGSTSTSANPNVNNAPTSIESEVSETDGNEESECVTDSVGILSDSEEICAICFKALNKNDEKVESAPIEIPCNHCYHLSCIKIWTKKSRKCPLCEAVIPINMKATVYF